MLYALGLAAAAILILLGLLGSVLPVLPGPPLSFAGLFLLALIRNFSPPLTATLILMMVMMTIGVTVLDYFIPLIGAKRYGASKWGIWGSVGGMVIGAFFSPFGILLGAFVGAVSVEWVVSKKKGQALRAGWGIFVGSILGLMLKLALSGMMAYYFMLVLV